MRDDLVLKPGLGFLSACSRFPIVVVWREDEANHLEELGHVLLQSVDDRVRASVKRVGHLGKCTHTHTQNMKHYTTIN